MKKEGREELPNDTIIIGNKPEFIHDPKTSETIPTEPYLRSIMARLLQHNYVIIKTLPYPDKMAKINGIYELLKGFGVREIYGSRKRVYEKLSNPDLKKVEVIHIKWEMIDRMKKYKAELSAEIKDG